jgi:hypothetical protein
MKPPIPTIQPMKDKESGRAADVLKPRNAVNIIKARKSAGGHPYSISA